MLDLPADKVVAIATGRYTHAKNQITLIKAAEKVERELATGRLFLLLLGATERKQVTANEDELHAYVRGRNLGGFVRLLSDVRDVEHHLRASDVYAMPSYYDEGMSNALVEAMATGLPILSSNIAQNVAVLPSRGALFFDPLDVDALAAHLVRLIGSPEERARMGAANAAFAKANYDNRHLSERYVELLSGIASRGREHTPAGR
jgi:glycosyltransferase involved in cell wall biosynthesis